MRWRDVTVASVLFAIFVAMVTAAARYPNDARLVPLVVGIPGMLLASWQLSRELVTRRAAADKPADPGDRGRARTEGRSLAWLVLFALMVLAGGFVFGGTLGVMACQRLWLRESWRTTLAGGAIALFVSYFCFERTLGLTLFSGWLSALL